MKKLVLVLSAMTIAAATSRAVEPLSLAVAGPGSTVTSGPLRGEDPRIAEINAFDPTHDRIYVVNPLDGRLNVIDAHDPNALAPLAPLDLVAACQAADPSCPLGPGGEPNSVAIFGTTMVVAVGAAVRTDNGHAVLFDLTPDAPAFLAAVEVGAVPDMVTFSEDGRFALVANEGEPNQAYTIDPPGSVSIIEVARAGEPGAARAAGFERFDNPGQRAKLEREGVRIFGPGASVSQDLEPEYIAVHRNKAYVSLQENNALAIINIAGATVEQVVGLGLKDHSLPGNALDTSDQGGTVTIANRPVHGMYMPDAIHAFAAKGRTYLIMANEGDAREYAAYVEAVRLNNAAYVLDSTAFPDAAQLKANSVLGRLNVTTASGDVDGDGDFDRIDVFGARSVSIRDHEGRLVWDSGDLFERLSAQFDGIKTVFNTTNTANSFDNRSDDKGVEPESVAVGEVNGRPYAFLGLERDSGIVVLDLSNPAAPQLVTYVTNRKLPRVGTSYAACNDTGNCGDLGPEGLTFVPASSSPNGKALLIVSNEVSSTTTVWTVQ